MPNPFVRLPGNLSREQDADKGAIVPVPEEYEGFNLPYRGIETHGVEPNAEPREFQGYAEGREVEYESPQPPTDVVPVRIVETGNTRELRKSRFYHEYATVNNARPVVGFDDSRSKVTIRNLGATRVWIGDSAETASTMHGTPLDEHEKLESTTQDTLFALSGHAADSMELSIMVEYSIALPK
jgi:hypothetical protein